ncbi:MAG TPA: galactokinase, partial [Chloroflexota bacterium]|nr:galactokinase [Chloroflexota bacterium]
LGGDPLQPKQLAALGCRVENDIIGVESGLMDQLAVACGVEGHALLIDCRTTAVELVALPRRAEILILDTGIRRALTGSEYNRRRAECRSALAKLQAVEPTLNNLRDVTMDMVDARSDVLGPAEFRRVRHVVAENSRVLLAASALKRDDLTEFGRLMYASHVSLRDDFEVSGPELDLMVSLAAAQAAVFGARLTGAGFGGCAVALVEAGSAASVASAVAGKYRRETGHPSNTYVCRPDFGARIIALA